MLFPYDKALGIFYMVVHHKLFCLSHTTQLPWNIYLLFTQISQEEEKKKLITTNDVEKCKAPTKNKRKPLKLKVGN